MYIHIYIYIYHDNSPEEFSQRQWPGLRLEVFGFTEGCTSPALTDPQGIESWESWESGNCEARNLGGFNMISSSNVVMDLI